MPSNGTHSSAPKGFDLQTLLVSVSSAGVIACFAFLWNVNSTLARIQEKQSQETKYREDDRTTINQMQLDIRDLRDRAIRTERLTEYNSQQLQKPTK